MRRVVCLPAVVLTLTACDDPADLAEGTTGDDIADGSSSTGEADGESSTGEESWDGDVVSVRLVESERACSEACGASACISATNTLIPGQPPYACAEVADLHDTLWSCACADSPTGSLPPPTHAVSACLDATAYPNPMTSCDAWCGEAGLGACAWAYASDGCLDVPGGDYEYALPEGGGDYDGGADSLRFVCAL